MHKKQEKYNLIISLNKAENNKRIKRNEEKVCVCVCVYVCVCMCVWMLDGVWLVH
jgi:hypothetical protein